MNRVNICSAELGAEILDFSSTNDDEMCQASNVLLDQEDVQKNLLRKYGIVKRDYPNILSLIFKKLSSTTIT